MKCSSTFGQFDLNVFSDKQGKFLDLNNCWNKLVISIPADKCDALLTSGTIPDFCVMRK